MRIRGGRKMSKVLIIGSKGQLGSDLVNVFEKKHEVLAPSHEECDIDVGYMGFKIPEKVDLVINCAAFHDVEKCEKSPDQAFGINSFAVYEVAYACKMSEIPLIHISTNYVFDGEKLTVYCESDAQNPVNVYGLSKLAGEVFIKGFLKEYYIVRTSSLFGSVPPRGKKHNFVDWVLNSTGEIRVKNDEFSSPTYTNDLAEAIFDLVTKHAEFGVYHLVNKGMVSWYDFAMMICEVAGKKDLKVLPVTSNEFPSMAKRPLRAGLNSGKYHSMPELKDALRRYIWEKAAEKYR